MNSLKRDPIINVIHNGIKRGIEVAVKNHCYVDAAILVYSGIDSMAYLGMPELQDDVERKDFIDWADRYIDIAVTDAPTGLEYYAARCGVVHTHSASSRLFRSGKVRMLFYSSEPDPPIRFDPSIDSTFVVVSVPVLVQAFFAGVDRFIVDLYKDKERARIADDRFKNILHSATVEELENNGSDA